MQTVPQEGGPSHVHELVDQHTTVALIEFAARGIKTRTKAVPLNPDALRVTIMDAETILACARQLLAQLDPAPAAEPVTS